MSESDPLEDESQALEALYELFLDLFDDKEFRLWAHKNYGSEFHADLPGAGASPSILIHNGIHALSRRGLIDATLFERLKVERPARSSTIDSYAFQWARFYTSVKHRVPPSIGGKDAAEPAVGIIKRFRVRFQQEKSEFMTSWIRAKPHERCFGIGFLTLLGSFILRTPHQQCLVAAVSSAFLITLIIRASTLRMSSPAAWICGAVFGICVANISVPIAGMVNEVTAHVLEGEPGAWRTALEMSESETDVLFSEIWMLSILYSPLGAAFALFVPVPKTSQEGETPATESTQDK